MSGLSISNKVYDATTAASLVGTASVATLGSDVVTVSGGSGSFANKNAGNAKAVTVSGLNLGGADAGNYKLVAPSNLTADITPANLTVSGLSISNKVYDTTTTASVGGSASVAALGNDMVWVFLGRATGAFADKGVGKAKAVTVSGMYLLGNDGRNYQIMVPSNLTADITPANLTVSGLSASNKVYDATTAASLGGTASVQALGSDVVTVSGGSGSFASKNVGNAKAVTVSGLNLAGADAANYQPVAPTNLTADITPANLTVSGLSISNKVYDATTAASLVGTASVATLGSDVVTVSGGSGSFANKNAGNAKAVTVSGLNLGGADAGNYKLVAPSNLTADITPANLTVSGLSISNKVYDTTTTASVGGTASVAALGNDTVTVTGTATGAFADKRAGKAKTVTVSGLSLRGNDASNYQIMVPSNLTADITPANLTVSGLSASNKVYDATTAASLGGTASVQALGSDVVTVSGGSGSFASKNVGNAKAVTVSGLNLAGADAANYQPVAPTNLTADITPANLTVSGLSISNKVYDATTTASVGGTASVAALGNDTVKVAGTATGAFADKGAGTVKAVTVSGLSLSGNDARNYQIVVPSNLTADITPADLAVSGLSASNKAYDATTTASLVGTASAKALGSDVVTVNGGSGSFVDKNVGYAKAVTVSGLSLAGADAGNYLPVAPTNLKADITRADLPVAGLSASNKVYDATATASLTGTASVAPLGSDAVTVSGGSGSFASKNVGNAKAVTVSGLNLGGVDAENYLLVAPGNLTANITPANLVVGGLSANNKVYDATTAASLSGTASVAPLGNDVVTVSGGSGSFANKNAGRAKAVTVSGLSLGGVDAQNYLLVAPGNLAADITPANLAVAGLSANNKVYDATTTANLSGTPTVTPLRSDAVVVAGTAVGLFSSQGVGAGKAVSVSGLGLTGADAGNYAIVLPENLSAAITPASLQYLADAKSFPSGAQVPTLTGTLLGLVGGETLATATQGQLLFSTTVVNSTAPGNYAITGSGLTAQNYVLAQAPGNATALTVKVPEVAVVAPQALPAALPEVPATPSASALRQAGTTPALTVAAPAVALATTAQAGRSGSDITVTLAPPVAGAQGASVAVSLPAALVRSGEGFAFVLPDAVMQEARASGATARITQANGEALPAWLVVDAQTGRFTASQVPQGGLPLRVRVSVGGFTATVEITVRSE